MAAARAWRAARRHAKQGFIVKLFNRRALRRLAPAGAHRAFKLAKNATFNSPKACAEAGGFGHPAGQHLL
ncbi:hypothetical protein BEN74_10170 [Acinetobacter sp. WCHAc010034]|nr:hypothetical protein BEN74_10170 [Acinetobacter sp. WCHAc010034]